MSYHVHSSVVNHSICCHLYRITPANTKHLYTIYTMLDQRRVNPFPAELSYLNFHPLEVVSRCRDPRFQVCLI